MVCVVRVVCGELCGARVCPACGGRDALGGRRGCGVESWELRAAGGGGAEPWGRGERRGLQP